MVGESLDHNLKIKKTKFKQGIFSTTLDDLISRWKLPIPNYLKIDVDGIEFKIIEKSKKLLKNNNLHSVLIEINPNCSINYTHKSTNNHWLKNNDWLVKLAIMAPLIIY